MNIASQFESFFFQLQTKVRKLFTNPCIWRQRNPCCPQAHGVLNFSLTEKNPCTSNYYCTRNSLSENFQNVSCLWCFP